MRTPERLLPGPNLASRASLKRISSPETDLAWQLLASTAPPSLGQGEGYPKRKREGTVKYREGRGDGYTTSIYESSLRAGHGWRESLYRHQRCFEASDCGRLGRQAAGHPWSALRVVKSCRKDCPTASVLPKPKQQLCIQSGTRAHYLNYLQEVGEAGKRSAGNRIGYQVIDRRLKTDRQVETGR